MSTLFNEGDTTLLLLDFTINGQPMEEDAYDELELQFNEQCSNTSVRKLLSAGDIVWGTATYEEDDEIKNFTGYVCPLTQEETFKLREGITKCQLRVMLDGEVGSSEIIQFGLGDTLSREVLSSISELFDD